MAARITKSLDTLRSQVNALAPKRSKASDGWLGDSKHSMRKSDHNPEPDGTVDAFDLTHDPKNGVDIQRVCDAIIASKDRRVSYLICNGKIIAGNSGPKPWVKRNYTGPNKHTKHLHISVLDAHQDDTTPWKIEAAFRKAALAAVAPLAAKPPVPAVRAQPEPEPAPRASAGPAADTVAYVQTRLRELGYAEVGAVDGMAGDQTETAILAFRKNNGLALTPAIDDALLIALPKAQPRVLAPERTGATPKEVRAEVPEVRANWFGKVWSLIAGAGALVTGAISWLMDNFGGIKEQIQPVLDMLGDVPVWLYLGLFAAAAFFAWQKMRQGEAAGVAAFQSGERR